MKEHEKCKKWAITDLNYRPQSSLVMVYFCAMARWSCAHAPFQILNLARIHTQCRFDRSKFQSIQLNSNLLSKRHHAMFKWQELEKLSVRPDSCWLTIFHSSSYIFRAGCLLNVRVHVNFRMFLTWLKSVIYLLLLYAHTFLQPDTSKL